jgi:hypothetical protein
VLTRISNGLLVQEIEHTGWFTEEEMRSIARMKVRVRLTHKTRRIVGIGGFETNFHLDTHEQTLYNTPMTVYMPQTDEMYLVDRRGRYYHLARCLLSKPRTEIPWTYFLVSQVFSQIIGMMLGLLLHHILFF